MSASATTEELRDTVRGLAADVTRRQQDAESLSRRIAEREGELAGGDGTAAEAAAVAPAAIAGLAGQVAPLVDQLTRDRGELEAAEREIEALLELEAKLAAAGESADESHLNGADVASELSRMREETERLLAAERDQAAADRAFIDELTRDFEEYERCKARERAEADAEAARKVDALRRENELLRRMFAEKENAAAAPQHGAKDPRAAQDVHGEFLRVFTETESGTR
eukprot:TRINITY_DN15014_c0_g1_i1.p1 TRINITY_DN15014_c0_g1~~TRINITY_DN15014_c0_g1_i1.p1  ORF type:complete len:248 (+),score=127.20 TRINITY_DN15014_c0_g1_i1:66-746(+)